MVSRVIRCGLRARRLDREPAYVNLNLQKLLQMALNLSK